jgi:hypothetical protein
VLVIDGKNNRDDGEQEKHKLKRRSEQYAEIKAQKVMCKLRVRSLKNHLINKLTMLIA